MAAKTNENERFVRIYNAYIDEIYRFVYLRTGFDAPLAEDITQDIFVNVLSGMNKFKGLCSDRTWVYRLASNRIADYYRQLVSQQKAAQLQETEDVESDCEIDFECNEDYSTLKDCLSELPQQYRAVLLCKYADSMSVSHISALFDKTPKSIEGLLRRAKATFAKLYAAKIKRKEELTR